MSRHTYEVETDQGDPQITRKDDGSGQYPTLRAAKAALIAHARWFAARAREMTMADTVPYSGDPQDCGPKELARMHAAQEEARKAKA